MSKDDFDIFRHLSKPEKPTSALDLILGLHDRQRGHGSRSIVNVENLGLFAEDQLVRKEDLKEMRCEMPGHPRSTFLMVFSPDGRRAASTHGNHSIYVTDLRSGKNIKTLVGHPRTPWCIAFHPTSDQIVASGCLGGQVRIWDLSGGSEVWTTATESVIASIAFHPNDRILVIATLNEVYFWDWSQPEPFVHVATSNQKEKVRYVAFDKLGHKLITGIANHPQTRWERVRAPVPVPRQERSASPYRRRITQRLVTPSGILANPQPPPTRTAAPPAEVETGSAIPERERRITQCYRNLVREYELLVHRYLQLYRPPTMIDRGTDPMESSYLNSGTQTATGNSASEDPSQPGPSGLQSSRNVVHNRTDPGPSSSTQTDHGSTHQSQPLITPSRIFTVRKKPPSSIQSTQTTESRKHKSEAAEPSRNVEKRFKRNDDAILSSSDGSSDESLPQPRTEGASAADADDRTLVVNLERLPAAPSNEEEPQNLSRHRLDRKCKRRSAVAASSGKQVTDPQRDNMRLPEQPGPSARGNSDDNDGRRKFLAYMDNLNKWRSDDRTSPLMRAGNIVSTIIEAHLRDNSRTAGQPGPSGLSRGSTSRANPQPNLQETPIDLTSPRTGENERTEENQAVNENSAGLNDGHRRQIVEEVLSNIRRMAEEVVRNRILPIIRSIPPPDRPELIRLFENSREHVRMRMRLQQMCPVFLRRHCRRTFRIESSTDSSSSDNEQDAAARLNLSNSANAEGGTASVTEPVAPLLAGINPSTTSLRAARNYTAELDQLITTFLNEIEPNESAEAASTDRPTTAENLSYSGSTSARTRPSRHEHPWTNGANDPPPGASIESLMFREEPSERAEADEARRPENLSPWSNLYSRQPTRDFSRNSDPRIPPSNSPTASPPNRRRFFSRRVSAFMPTRVNYTRSRSRWNTHYSWGSGRAGLPRSQRNQSYGPDELVNYAERENSEDDPPPPPPPTEPYPYESPPPPPPTTSTSSTTSSYFRPFDISPTTGPIGTMYSNIVQDLESSLSEIRNITDATGQTETSDILTSFSQRMDNITNLSNRILRNVRVAMDLLPTASTEGSASRSSEDSDGRWGFNDSTFYVRDIRRTEISNGEFLPPPGVEPDLLDEALYAVTSDHTYPRQPHTSPTSDNVSPMMNSLYLTTSHIQRQARLLRRRVDSIERVDRAAREVSQLQLMRQLITEMVGYVRTLPTDSRGSGLSGVRQMMAGTRISDSGPYEAPTEEGAAPAAAAAGPSRPQPSTSSSSTSGIDLPGPSSATSSNRRTTNRKTYPPSRYVRLSRHYQRRPALVHLFSKRCPNRFERGGVRHTHQSRPGTSSSGPPPSVLSQIFNFSIINSSTLTLMTRRLERTLTEQMRAIMGTQTPPAPTSSMFNNRPMNTVDLREHILALRLHGCLLRMNRVLGHTVGSENLRRLRSDAATRDGSSRYVARHTLSLVMDGMTRYIEELGGGGISVALRVQLHGVFAMALLLTELLLFEIVDAIPPASGFTLDGENLARRVDNICFQMLQSRIIVGSGPLRRGLRLMRNTMRHAHRALDRTYAARRSAIVSRQATDRRQLLGIIDNCLRSIGRMHYLNGHDGSSNRGEGTSASGGGAMPDYTESFYSTINDLISRYSEREEETAQNHPSTSTGRETRERREPLSSNNNSDTDQDETLDSYLQRRPLNDPPSTPPERVSGFSSPFWLRPSSPSPAPPPPPPSSGGSSNVYRSHPYITMPNRRLPQAASAVAAAAAAANESSPPPSPPLGGGGPSASRPWNIPSVQVNDVPVSFEQGRLSRQNLADALSSQLRSNPRVGLFRPRFLHPLYASVNPFDADLDDLQREQIYDSDMITTATPNHRIQAWEIANSSVPSISNPLKNVVVGECKIHNDASVDIATDGTILVTLLPSGGYLNVTNRLGVYSLRWETLGQCLYTTSFEQNAVSVSLSPLSRHLVVGFASRRVSIVPSDRWVMARIYKIEQKDVPGDRLPALRELEQHRESRINCIRWLPSSGQGLIYATNTGQLVILS